MSHWMKWIVAACTVTLLAACGGNDDDEPAAQPRNIVQTAQSDARFSILVEAVVAADLAGTLSAVSYTNLRAHETVLDLVCRLLLAKKKQTPTPAKLVSVIWTPHALTPVTPRLSAHRT